MFLTVLLLILNFGISWFNAWSVGRSWADSKAIGGWPRFMTWCGAIMSASGFTYVYVILLALLAGSTGYLPMQYVRAALELGYVIILIPILGSGMAIWIDSVTTAWRQRDAMSIGTAAWNTFAQAHNIYSAATTLPSVFSDLGGLFKDADDDDAKGRLMLIAVLIVVLALAGGIFTTAAIVRSTARSYAAQVGLTGRIHYARS